MSAAIAVSAMGLHHQHREQMMRHVASLLLIALLASCGADGAPTPPVGPNLSVSGQVKLGVTGSL